MITSAPQSTEIFQAPQTGATASQVVPVIPSPPPPPPPPSPPPQAPLPPVPAGSKKKFIIIGAVIMLMVIILFFVLRLVFFSGPKEEENAELTYWGLYEDQRVMQVLIDEFERENKNIKVTFVQQDPNQYRDRLMTRIRNGTGPDIFRYHNSWVPMLTGVLLPLSEDVVKPAEFKKAYYPVITTDLVYNGGIVGIPLSIDTLALYTNNQMFSSQRLRPPQNWEDFVRVAAALTTRVEEGEEKGKITTAGTAMGTYDNVTHAPDIVSLLFVQSGVNLRDIAALKEEEKVDQCETRACVVLKYYTIFARGGGSIQKVWDGSLDSSMVAFANGRVGMYFGYSWDIFAIRAINPSLSFSIYPVPQLDSNNKKAIASYWVEGVSNQTKYPQAAMKFMKYLNTKETQEKFYTETAKLLKLGTPYSRVDLAAALKSEPLLYPFVMQAPYAVSTPFVADTRDNGLNASLNGYLKNAILEASGNTSAETAIETLDLGIKQTYKQYGQ